MTPETELMDAQHLAEWLIKRLALRGWTCRTVESCTDTEDGVPGICLWDQKEIQLRRDSVKGGVFEGKNFSAHELAVHEVAHILRDSYRHDATFYSTLEIVEAFAEEL